MQPKNGKGICTLQDESVRTLSMACDRMKKHFNGTAAHRSGAAYLLTDFAVSNAIVLMTLSI